MKVWIDERPHFVASGRQTGKATAQREAFDQAADAGEHVHQVSVTTSVCANGDDTCPVWRSQQ